MAFSRFLLCASLVMGLIVSSGSPAFAQNDLTVIEFRGKLEGGQGNVLLVNEDSGKQKKVLLPPLVSYSAEAKPAWLKPNLFVRFSAEFDANQQMVGSLNAFEVFVPMLNPRRNNEEELKKNVPGIYPAGAAKGTNLLDEKNKGAAPAAQKYNVVGKLAWIDQESMTVQVGPRPLKVAISPNVKIAVKLQSLELAKPGDAVSVSGLFSPKQPEVVNAQTVSITAAKPLDVEEQIDPSKLGKGSAPSKKSKATSKPDKKGTEKKGTDKKSTDK